MNQALHANLASAYDQAARLETLAKQLRFNIGRMEVNPAGFAHEQVALAGVALVLRDQCVDLSKFICEIEP